MARKRASRKPMSATDSRSISRFSAGADAPQELRLGLYLPSPAPRSYTLSFDDDAEPRTAAPPSGSSVIILDLD